MTKTLVTLALALLLVSCGGGGNSSQPPQYATLCPGSNDPNCERESICCPGGNCCGDPIGGAPICCQAPRGCHNRDIGVCVCPGLMAWICDSHGCRCE